jgi:hypothetical protein
MSPGNDSFEERVREDLRKIVADTSPALRARIAKVTNAALDEAQRPAARRWLPTLVPVGGVAALAVAVVAIQLLQSAPAPAPEKLAPIPPGDLAMLLNVDNLDLLEQMEFYLWLDREPGVLDAEGAAAPEPPRRS